MRRAVCAAILAAALLPAPPSLGRPSRLARPEYVATVTRIPRDVRQWMTGLSWRPGCPVPLRALRLVTLRYWGFDDRSHIGRLVVHRDETHKIVRAFRRLYGVSYPIRRMRLVDFYGADDRTSMAHDNTSAFNCRYRAGSPGEWSQHAYGRAVDVNPVENPYVWSGGVSPPNGADFVDRSQHRPGMIHHRDAVWWAFHYRGWEWGGDWTSVKDYQHFSENGR